MLEQAQSTSLSKQESVLQKQDRCKKTKVVTALKEESQHHFSKTRLKEAASQQERVSVWPNPGELLSESHTWFFLRWTGEQTQNLSSDWDREANWAPTEEPSSKTLFYNLLSRPSARNPEGLQTWISFCCVSVSGWCDPGCRHPTSIRCCRFLCIIYAADFKFLPATPTLPAPQNLERNTLMALLLLCHEAKAEPDMVVSAVVFRVEDIFGSKERKVQRFVCGNLKEVQKPLPKSYSFICESPQAYLMHCWKAVWKPSTIPGVKAKFQSS